MERDFSLGGRSFRLNKIDAVKQFHVVRRIGPILSDLIPALKANAKVRSVEEADKLSESERLDIVVNFAAPIMGGLSKLSNEDSEFVLFSLLGSVEMQQSTGNWMRVATPSIIAVQDLELPMLLQIASKAFIFNLSDFFSALPQ